MSQPQAVLAKHKLRPKKRLGQNFLSDEESLQLIADNTGLSKKNHILEIGAGIGNLSVLLAKTAEKFYALEKDRSLKKPLTETLKPFNNTEIIFADILEFNLKTIFKDTPLIVVGNLPYYITSPILIKLIEQKEYIQTILITIQKEVAQRIVSPPGKKNYGRLSCLLQFYTEPQLLEIFPKKLFYPRPEVDSALVRLDILEKPSIDVLCEKTFFRTVKSAFAQRRKTLLNSLAGSGGLCLTKEDLKTILESLNIKPNIRGEQLSLKELGKLSDEIQTKTKPLAQ
ncbi:MAG: ribosomal RNA small subunit methyltransferase A [PVC group bacterium]|nr:ribosomal RNA small subunit methyltransferase A [PVC group bacterium]